MRCYSVINKTKHLSYLTNFVLFNDPLMHVLKYLYYKDLYRLLRVCKFYTHCKVLKEAIKKENDRFIDFKIDCLNGLWYGSWYIPPHIVLGDKTINRNSEILHELFGYMHPFFLHSLECDYKHGIIRLSWDRRTRSTFKIIIIPSDYRIYLGNKMIAVKVLFNNPEMKQRILNMFKEARKMRHLKKLLRKYFKNEIVRKDVNRITEI
jgi:hypothetical protein